jgi:hypothetical protein
LERIAGIGPRNGLLVLYVYCKLITGFGFSESDHPPDSYRDFADSAIARLDTPPFFFFEKVGGEMFHRIATE